MRSVARKVVSETAIPLTGAALKPRGGVDDVAGDDPLSLLRSGAERDDSFSGVDADADLERQLRVVLVQLGDRIQDAKPCPHGPLGVVLMREGRPEDGHDRVPDELLHRPRVALDLLA